MATPLMEFKRQAIYAHLTDMTVEDGLATNPMCSATAAARCPATSTDRQPHI
jgi:hypothetical protein